MEFFKWAWIVTGISLMLFTEVSTTHQNFDRHDQRDMSASRIKRSVTEHNNCSNWSDWINRNTPTSTHRMDREYMSTSDFEEFCPRRIGGIITQMMCLESTEGPFTGMHEDTDKQYMFRCGNITEGGVCTLQNVHADPCPDVAVKYFCSCASPSPLDATPLLLGSTPSPRGATPPTPDVTPSPIDATPPTPNAETSPTYATPPTPNAAPSPTDASPSPFGYTPSSLGSTTSPTHATPSPLRTTSSPLGFTPSSLGATPSPLGATPSPVVENDVSSSEENDETNNDLPHTMLIYHTVPTACAFLLVIILCCIIITLLCKKLKPASINPLQEKPLGIGHLF